MLRFVRAAVAGFIFVAIGASAPAFAQTRLFSDNSEIQIVIEAPLGALIRASERSTDPFPAVATVIADGVSERFDIQLSARGVSRRTGDICTFPPLRLDFDQTRGTFMQGQNRLKLVTRCRNGASFERLTVLEYMTYRLYNEITPLSFRVRPVQVTYRPTDGRSEETQFNFLIEDVDDLARRNNGLVALDVLADEVRSSQLDAQQSAIYGLFQLMIANLDWDMVSGHAGEECCHNSKLIAVSAESRQNVIPVPYDFDFSGLVDAPYATPPEGINISSVRTRHYRGLCRHNEQVPAAAELFRSRREQIFAVIDGETRLTENARRNARRYIEQFYEILDDPARFNRQVIEACRR